MMWENAVVAGRGGLMSVLRIKARARLLSQKWRESERKGEDVRWRGEHLYDLKSLLWQQLLQMLCGREGCRFLRGARGRSWVFGLCTRLHQDIQSQSPYQSIAHAPGRGRGVFKGLLRPSFWDKVRDEHSSWWMHLHLPTLWLCYHKKWKGSRTHQKMQCIQRSKWRLISQQRTFVCPGRI